MFGWAVASRCATHLRPRSAGPITAELAAAALLLTGLIGIPIGVIAALAHRGWLDNLIRVISLFGASLAIAGPSFLGLGTPPPTPECGSMLAEARTYFSEAPALVFPPGLAVMLLALGVNLVGDGLRDLLHPRLRAQASS